MCMVCCIRRVFVFFFFQAEDGIRDAQESRGLGDVYKRQTYVQSLREDLGIFRVTPENGVPDFKAGQFLTLGSVSYTHLTLPTKRIV